MEILVGQAILRAAKVMDQSIRQNDIWSINHEPLVLM